MVRKVDVRCPASKTAAVVETLERLRICHDLTIHTGAKSIGGKGGKMFGTISFKCIDKKTSLIISALDRLGAGSEWGSVDITALESTKPMISSKLDAHGREIPNKVSSIRDRLTIGEIFHSIDSQCHMTFDYLVMAGSASMICACGLLDDNVVLVVASMLVSPLMGPILALVYGTMMRDNRMTWKGFRTEISGIFVIWIVGVLSGFLMIPWDENSDESWLVNIDQLNRRGEEMGLVVGVLVAVPSGIALAIAVTSDVVAPFVGVAISAALLPPICASGLATSLGIVSYISYGLNSHSEQQLHTAYIAMVLFLINWVLIYVFGLWTFYIKKVIPSHSVPDPRFLNEPIIKSKKRPTNVVLKDQSSAEEHLLSDTQRAEEYMTFEGTPFQDESELRQQVQHAGRPPDEQKT